MWIDREIIPALIDATEIQIKEEMKVHETDGAGGGEYFDPNDLVIFQSFVLPLLEKKKDTGFNSEEMLNKGFSFMVSLIPAYLKEYRERLNTSSYGKLAKLYYNHSLNTALSYLNSIEEKYIKENIENINKYIDLSKIPGE